MNEKEVLLEAKMFHKCFTFSFYIQIYEPLPSPLYLLQHIHTSGYINAYIPTQTTEEAKNDHLQSQG